MGDTAPLPQPPTWPHHWEFFSFSIVSENAVNFKATAIYVEEVHEGAHILCFRLINKLNSTVERLNQNVAIG